MHKIIIRLLAGFYLLSFLNTTPAQATVTGSTTIDTAHYYMEHSYDVQKYTLTFDWYSNYTTPYPKTYSAKAIIKFRADSAINNIWLNATATSLQIDSVGLDASSFSVSGDTLHVVLDKVFNPGQMAEISVCFRHKNVSDQAFYVSSGYVFTDFPPEGARKVFPCWDRPSDKALTDIKVKVPLNVRLGSTGSLADSVVSGDTIWYHWVSRDPVATYLITITSKSNFLINKSFYNLLTCPDDSIPVRIYYKNNESITIVNNLIGPLTDFYSQKFGDYSFEKIGFATLNAAFPWGGMENQTMVNLMPGGYSNEGVIAHEHAHQWFGDLITCGTWADVWLNEGFATWVEALWTEYKNGYPAYLQKMKGLAQQYISQNPGFPIYNPEWAIHTPPAGQLYSTAITYNKGACVLHQLRCLTGDSVFFHIMKTYATDTAFTFKNAVTLDFMHLVDSISGEDYHWFFDQWVYHPDHPVYNNSYAFINEGQEQWKLDFLSEQIQTNTCIFTNPAEIKVTFSDNSDTVLVIHPSSAYQLFSFNLNKQPVSLVFDPDFKILPKEASTVNGTGKERKTTGSRLYQNSPNPFGTSTEIIYYIDTPGDVHLDLIDSRGKTVKVLVHGKSSSGRYNVKVDSGNLSKGVYFYRLRTGSEEMVKKMIFLD